SVCQSAAKALHMRQVTQLAHHGVDFDVSSSCFALRIARVTSVFSHRYHQEKPEAVAPDHHQHVEQQVDKARKNGERARKSHPVQHRRSTAHQPYFGGRAVGYFSALRLLDTFASFFRLAQYAFMRVLIAFLVVTLARRPELTPNW